MTDVHVLGDVRRTKVDQNALIFLSLGLLLVELDLLTHVDVTNLFLDEAGLKSNVQEETTLGRVPLTNLGEVNLFNCVI